MIFVPIMLIIYGLLGIVFAVLPVYALPDSWISGIATIFNYAFSVSQFLPMDTFLSLLKASVYVDGILLLIWGTMFIVNNVRGR